MLFLSDYKQLFKDSFGTIVMIDYEARLSKRMRILRSRGVENVHRALGLNLDGPSDQEIAIRQWDLMEERERRLIDADSYSK
jgi:hypothetical protein